MLNRWYGIPVKLSVPIFSAFSRKRIGKCWSSLKGKNFFSSRCQTHEIEYILVPNTKGNQICGNDSVYVSKRQVTKLMLMILLSNLREAPQTCQLIWSATISYCCLDHLQGTNRRLTCFSASVSTLVFWTGIDLKILVHAPVCFFVSVHSSTQQGHICLSSLEIACSVVSSLGFFMHQKTVGDKWICFEEDTVLVGARPSCSSCANMNAILNVRTLSPNFST